MKSISDFYPKTLQDCLQHHADESKLAIVWEDEQGQIQRLLYDDLFQKVLAQAAALQSLCPNFGKGRQREIRVGVWLPRTAEFVTSFLSIWFSGAVYVPISDSSLEHLNSDSKFKADFEHRVRVLAPHLDVIITDVARAPVLQALTSVKLLDTTVLGKQNHTALKPLIPEVQSEAFVFCSSGTSGPPKIIVIPHEGISDRVQTVTEEMNVIALDSILQYTGFDFDPSVMEILQAMRFGIPLIMAPEYARLNPQSLSSFFEKLHREQIPLPNFAIIVPSMLKLIDPKIFTNLKNLMTTGENILPKDLVPWFTQHENLRVFTGYGPTETTWGATLTEISRDPIYIHVTKPMQGIELKLLSTEEGIHEILIGGNGHGYYIGENAEAYTQKNWVEFEGQRYFKTHDGVIVANEKLIYSGRIDELIKYHGKWISLDEIDTITEYFQGIQNATTISISGTSLLLIFVVLSHDIPVNIAALEADFRQKTSGELFPTFFEVQSLRFNARGKRCRHLKDYSGCSPLSIPKASEDPLKLLWTLALAEIELTHLQDVYAEVGIQHFQHYLPNYSPQDRFDYLGGRSIKFPRLVKLLWDAYVFDPTRSQQNFKMGLLRYQSFGDMSQFIRIYQAAIHAVTTDKSQTSTLYPCLQIIIPGEIPEAWQSEFCDCLESEIRSVYPASFYHLVLRGDLSPFFLQIKSRLQNLGIIDDARQPTSTDVALKYYNQHLIKTLLCKPPRIDRSGMETLNISLTHRLTLLGTACGKTTFLSKQHAQLKDMRKVVCYLSCRELADDAENLQQYFALTQTQWDILCEGENSLSEITWLIDDIEAGIVDNRLLHLHNNLQRCRGKNFVIYAGRENFYPFALQRPEVYGQIELLSPPDEINLTEWFKAEAKRSMLSSAAFFKQLEVIFEAFKQRTYLRAECRTSWWANAAPERIQAEADLPPLYLSQYPSFSSLVRFLKYHDSQVYSLRTEFEASLTECLSSILSQTYTTVRSDVSKQSVNNPLIHLLPTHIQYFPGESFLSPWIFFHSISGICPEGYATFAETILSHTKQATIIFSMPIGESWESLEKQVESYLAAIQKYQLVPPGARYYLGGWSYGGYLAAEAARQIEQRGETVAVVVNLDAAPLFAFPDFQWENHTQYIHRYLLNSRNSASLIQGMQCNVRLLQSYCHDQTPRSMVQAKNYIFEATQQAASLKGSSFAAWQQHVSTLEHFKCDCDHFGIFTNSVLRTQFLKILDAHREQADFRSLSTRLELKARAFLESQDHLAKTLPPYIEPELERKIHQDFLENQESCDYLVIEGEPGTGKSRLCNHLAETLLRDSKTWVPIVFSLRKHLKIRDANALLALYGLSPSDLRQQMRFLFIFDGFDESELDLLEYPIRLSEYGQQSKVIITVRNGISPNIFQHKLTYTLPMLDDQQLGLWLGNFKSKQRMLRRLLESSNAELHWIRTPLALSLLLTLFQTGHDVVSLVHSNIYRFFQTLDQLQSLDNFSQLPLSETEKQLAYRRYRETLLLQEDVPHNSLWNYPNPITQAFKKAAKLIEQNGKLIFSHTTWRDYHLVNILMEAVLNYKAPKTIQQIPRVLFQFTITDLPKTGFLIRLIVHFWEASNLETRHTIRQNLFSIVLLSRRFKYDTSVQSASRNGMAMLNIFQISFSGLELAEVQIPDCDLSGARLANSRFGNTNLNGVNFTDADVEGTHYQGAQLDNITLNTLPIIPGNIMAYTSDGECFVVGDQGTLIIYDARNYQELWREKLSEDIICKIIVSTQNDIVCAASQEYFLVKRFKTTQHLVFKFQTKSSIQQISFSPNNQELAVLYDNGLEFQSINDTESRSQLIEIEKPTLPERQEPQRVTSPCFSYSPAGAEFAAIIFERLYVWTSETKSLIQIHELVNIPLLGLIYHPNGALLFVRSLSTIYSINTANHVIVHQYFPPIRTADCSEFLVDPLRNYLIANYESAVVRYKISADNESGKTLWGLSAITIDHITLSPSAKFLVAISNTEYRRNIYTVDLDTAQLDRQFEVPSSSSNDVVYHPHELHLAAVTANNKIRLWPLTLKPSLRQFLSKPRLNRLIFPLKSCFLLDISQQYFLFYPHNRSLFPFHTDGTHNHKLVTGIDEQHIAITVELQFGCPELFLHQINQKSQRVEIGDEKVHSFAFLPPEGSQIIVLTDSNVHLFDTSSLNLLFTIPNSHHANELSMSPNGKYVVLRATSMLIFIELNDPTTSHSIETDQQYRRFIHHPCKNQIAIANDENVLVYSPQEPLTRLAHDAQVTEFCYRPLHDELACITESHFLYFWNMTSHLCMEKLYLGFTRLKYAPDGDYFALWLSTDNAASVVQLWNANTRQCINEITLNQPVYVLEWLPTSTKHSNGKRIYHIAVLEPWVDIKVYEIVETQNAMLDVALLWSSARESVMKGQNQLQKYMLGQPQYVVTPVVETRANPANLDVLFIISDYLSYQDYCSFLVAFQIPKASCQQRRKRPMIDMNEWKRYAPQVGEQLQRFGFFAPTRIANIHDLKLQFLPEIGNSNQEPYQSVLITEEHGHCGVVDVYLLDDCIRIAKSY